MNSGCWVSVDDDGHVNVWTGTPISLDSGEWSGEMVPDFFPSWIRELAKRGVSRGCKRKLTSLDIVKVAVEYEGEEIHG